jgi:putative flavoprotein involved in K+ transport
VPPEKIETLIIGAGQAGLAMSEQLTKRGLPHLLVERARIAERWRSERWDGLHANGPAWHDRLPGLPIAGVAPDGFASRDQMVAYFAAYAEQIAAPVRCGVEVTELRKTDTGFRAETSAGPIEAAQIVAATGPFQRAVIPDLVPPQPGLLQMHSAAYRNPAQLPEGGILVIGAGSSGTQIADELARAGRRVHLCVGQHQRPPRSYRGQDFCYWLGALGMWNLPIPAPDTKHVTIAVSGAHGGQTIDFRRIAASGVTLLGRASHFEHGTLHVAPDLAENIAQGDASYLALLDAADAHIARENLPFPEEPTARNREPDPPSLTSPILSLNLKAADITTIIWATGYALDFSWIKCGSFDSRGKPLHTRGISETPGLYYLGLSWLSRRASSFIFGAEYDAAYLADHIARRVAAN